MSCHFKKNLQTVAGLRGSFLRFEATKPVSLRCPGNSDLISNRAHMRVLLVFVSRCDPFQKKLKISGGARRGCCAAAPRRHASRVAWRAPGLGGLPLRGSRRPNNVRQTGLTTQPGNVFLLSLHNPVARTARALCEQVSRAAREGLNWFSNVFLNAFVLLNVLTHAVRAACAHVMVEVPFFL